MPTIYDVAKRAGVSAMTVSRVINGKKDVKPETRERVLKAIEEIGYVPNSLARSFVLQRTRTIGLVITDITNPFFTTLARGVEDTAMRNQFSVIFCNTDEDPEKEVLYLELLAKEGGWSNSGFSEWEEDPAKVYPYKEYTGSAYR